MNISQWILLGVGALILLLLVLRFAMRPRRKVLQPSGLGLPAPNKSSLWGRRGAGSAPRMEEAVPAVGAGAQAASRWEVGTGTGSPAELAERAADEEKRAARERLAAGELAAGRERAATVFSTERPSPWEAPGTGSPADLAERAAADEHSGTSRTSAGAAIAGDGRGPAAGGCPKCGGRFLEGEMEGPTLMVDGVAREDFQPLLTARECAECGYLEFYTRPVKG